MRRLLLIIVLSAVSLSLSWGQNLVRHNVFDFQGKPYTIFKLEGLSTFEADDPDTAGFIIYLLYGDGQSERRRVSLHNNPHKDIPLTIADQWFIHRYNAPYSNAQHHEAFAEVVKVYTRDNDPPERVLQNQGPFPNFDPGDVATVFTNGDSPWNLIYGSGTSILIDGYIDMGGQPVVATPSWNVVRGGAFILRVTYDETYFKASNCDTTQIFLRAGPYLYKRDIGDPLAYITWGVSSYVKPPTDPQVPIAWSTTASGEVEIRLPVSVGLVDQEQKSIYVFFQAENEIPVDLDPTVTFTLNGPGSDYPNCPGYSTSEDVESSYDPNGVSGPCCIKMDAPTHFPYRVYFYNEGMRDAFYADVEANFDNRLQLDSVTLARVSREYFKFPAATYQADQFLCNVPSTCQSTVFSEYNINTGNIYWKFDDIFLRGVGPVNYPEQKDRGEITFWVSLKNNQKWEDIANSPKDTLVFDAKITFFEQMIDSNGDEKKNESSGIPVPLTPFVTGISKDCCNARCTNNHTRFNRTCECKRLREAKEYKEEIGGGITECNPSKDDKDDDKKPDEIDWGKICIFLLAAALAALFWVFRKPLWDLFRGSGDDIKKTK